MIHRGLSLCAVGILLSGCTAVYTNPGGGFAQNGSPPGYLYHDGNHPNDFAYASPEAVYNATHGTWLWPPAQAGRRD
jgi:hypothetical protein